MHRIFEKCKKILSRDTSIAIGISIVTFIIYCKTMSKSVGFTDTGELATVIATLGIAHPTGYPLFTLLGRVAFLIPISASIIHRLDLFNAVFTSLAAGIFYFIVQRMLCFMKHIESTGSALIERIISAVTSLTLAFSSTFWEQSTALEVYALHILMISLVMYSTLRASTELGVREMVQWFLLSSFFLGLSFGNHMTTVLLLPGLVYFFFSQLGWRKPSFILLSKMILLFLIGVSIYFYLPIRASNNPVMDWGHPATLERLVWHISGKQYRVWMFEGWSVAKKQLTFYLDNLPAEFHWICVPVVFIGIVELSRQNKKLFIFLLILFISTIFYSINYDIFDIGSYFLLSFIVLGLFFAIGLFYILNWCASKWKLRISYIVWLAFLFPCIQMISNYKDVDESKNFVPEDFTHSILNSLPSHAVVFSGIWDYFISPSIYYQCVEHQRPDLTIIDISLLKNRSWYFIQMKKKNPWLLERCTRSVDAFLVELDKFEHGQPFYPNVIQARWQEMLNDFVEQSLRDHPVFSDVRVESEFSQSYKRSPWDLLIRFSTLTDSAKYSLQSNFPIREKNKTYIINRDLAQYRYSMFYWISRWRQSNRLGE